MKIKHLHVTRYGPMVPFGRDDLGAFTLVHGPNERGKTLLIDALLRLLFKKELKKTYRRHFGNMNRVLEDPEGYVVLESRDVEHKLESNESLPAYFPAAITPEDFRNVFMVRDGDLTLNAESGYYSRVTEKLTGLRSSEIEKLLRAIQKRGRLRSISPDSELSNNVDHGKIASRIDDASALVEEIHSLKESLQSEGYDQLEAELVGVRERLGRLDDEIEIHRAAEETKRFKKARRTLSDLRRMLNTLERFKHFDAGELKRWQELELKRKRYEDDLRHDKKELGKIDRDIRSAKGELAANEAKAKKSREHLRRIEAELRPKIDAYQYERAEYRRGEPQSSLYKRGLIVSGAVFVLAVVGYLVRPSNLLVGLGGAALVVGMSIGIMLRKLRRSEGALQATIDNLYTESKRYGIKVESVDELISAVGDLEDEERSLEQELHVEKSEVETLEKEKNRIENRITSHHDHIGEIDAELLALQTATQKESAAQYQTVLDRQTKTEASAAAKQDVLRDMLPTEATGEAALEEWKARIDSQLRAADERQEIEYDAEAVSALKDEIEALKERRQKIDAGLKEGSRRLHSIEVKARELSVLDEPQPCRTTQELDYLGGLIEQYCSRIEQEKRTAQEAVRIFQAIDAEEKTRVGDLFGPEASVSHHIRAITDGRYQAAFYDLGKNAVYLTDAEGERVPAHCLSGGAYDQLYLSIRLSIAERLLAEEKGFFILDDPFVKADIDRLGRMLKMLKRLVSDGWQILYFTAKAEVTNLLSDDVTEGKVSLIQLDLPKREESAAGAGPVELFD